MMFLQNAHRFLHLKHVHTRAVFYFFLLCQLIIKLNAYLLDNNLILPDLNVDLPMQNQIQFLAEAGSIVNCDLNSNFIYFNSTKSSLNKQSVKFFWMVYSFLEQRFVRILDHTGNLLKVINTDEGTSLLFLPFQIDLYNANLHNNYYRCVLQYKSNYFLAGQVVKVQALISKNVELHVYDQQVELGSSALLKCVYSTDLHSYIRISGWLSDDGLIILPPTAYTSNIQIIKQRKYNILSTGELYISKVNHKDSNRRFRCQVINILTGERSESSSWARLTLTVRNTKQTAPILSHSESILDQVKSTFLVYQYETLLISCNFNVNPTPDIYWYKQQLIDNKLTLNKLEKNNFLFLPLITSKDIGKYLCIANNSHGQNKLEVNVKLKSQLKIKLISSTLNPQLDEEITINCSYTISTNQHYEIFWYKNMKKIEIDGINFISGKITQDIIKYQNEYLNHKLIINWLKIYKFKYVDSGIYQCFLRPSLINLNNKEHTPVLLTSNVYNNHVNSFLFSASTVESSFSSFLTNNQSYFNQNAVFLIIKEIKPTFSFTFGEQFKLPGNELWLKCVADGIPAPKITWKINGILLNLKHVQITNFQLNYQKTASHINISTLIISDSGYYECIASNSIGQISNQARINIMGTPGINLDQHSVYSHNYTAIAGKPFTLYCPYYGYPIEQVNFLRNDKKIISDEHFTEISLGQIYINQISKDDDGLYKCVVLSLKGEHTEVNINLKVILQPTISPFDFPNNLEEKMRASVICSVTSGDPPINMQWFRNNQLISNVEKDNVLNFNNYDAALMNTFSNLDFQIVNLNQFVSSLLISKLTSEYTGNYTCMANNEISSVNYSAFLQVKTQARFTIKPIVYQSSIVGEPIRFDCQADGYPQPIIRWKYLGNSVVVSHIKVDNSNINGQFSLNDQNFLSSVSILSSPRVHVLENGSLIIKQIQLEDEGNYQCEASNGIGQPTEAIAQLIVFQAPYLKLISDESYKKNLQSSSLDLSILSTPLTINNIHNKIYPKIFQVNKNLYRLNMINSFNPIISNINIISVKNGQKVVLICKVQGTQPINIEWTHNDCLLSQFNSILEEKFDDEFNQNLFYTIKDQFISDQLKQSILTIQIISNNNSGNYQCQASNFYGTDKSTIKLFVQEPPSSPNLNIIKNELSARSIPITWSINYTGNCLITGYEIQYKQLKINLDYQNDQLIITKLNNITFDLKLNQSQKIKNKSLLFNLTDTKVLKKLSLIQKDENLWNEANVLFINANDVQDIVFKNNANILETNNEQILFGAYVLRKLLPRVLYLIRIRAKNQIGYSQFSNSLLILTKKEAPTLTAKNITCLPLNSKSICIHWQLPIDFSLSTSDYFQSHTQLIEGFYIGYRIVSSDDNFNFITYYTRESDLLKLNLQNTNQLKHQQPLYQQNQHSKTFSNLTKLKLVYNYTFENLRKATKYAFVIQAFNSEGAGPYSNEVFSETFAKDSPKSPLIKIESLGNFNITIIWEKFIDLNQIQGYLLNYKHIINFDLHKSNNIDFKIDETNSKSNYQTIRLPKFYRKYTLSNLNCGSKYSIYLIAFNEVGESKPSNELKVSTKGSVPIAPSSSEFIVPNITSATLFLNTWKDGDCLLTHFTIQYKKKNEFQWKIHSTIQSNQFLQPVSLNLLNSNSNLFKKEFNYLNNYNLYSNNNNFVSNSLNNVNNFGQIFLDNLHPTTWYDLLAQAFNQAGKTEKTFIFSTLTLDGATVPPLILDNENNDFNTVAGTFISNDLYLNILLQFGPFTFALILLILFIFLSIYVIMMKIRLQHQYSIDQFTRNIQQDSVSLNSYSNNKLCSNLKSVDTLYEKNRISENFQDTFDNCEQTDLHKTNTIYYPPIYATDQDTKLLQMSTNNDQSTVVNNSTYINKIGLNFNSIEPNTINNLIAESSNNTDSLLSNNTLNSYINNVSEHATHLDCYSFNEPCSINQCIKNFPLSSFINTANLSQTLENSCALIKCKNNSLHVYDVPHCLPIE